MDNVYNKFFTFMIPVMAVFFVFVYTGDVNAQFGSDTIETSDGDLKITFLGHGSLLFEFDGKIIYADPSGSGIDWQKQPKADIVVITHEHGDHFQPAILSQLRKGSTTLLMNERCAEQIEGATVVKNGDTRTIQGIKIEVIPSYNIVHKRNGAPYHPKGRDNGYVITFGGKRVYVAGDTENHPEMKALKDIDIAFLPMNLPYTMTPEMVADAAEGFKPKILYLYHYRGGDTDTLEKLMEDVKKVELRIRTMY